MIKTGIELIAIERKEQIEKHGRTIESDIKNNEDQQLSVMASLLTYPFHYAHDSDEFPEGWNKDLILKMLSKDRLNQLVIAGALIAAEIDRIQNA